MIAISYRRQDSNPVAGRLYDRLQAEFGKGNVFMDFDSIPYGVDFREHIKHTLRRAKVIVAKRRTVYVANTYEFMGVSNLCEIHPFPHSMSRAKNGDADPCAEHQSKDQHWTGDQPVRQPVVATLNRPTPPYRGILKLRNRNRACRYFAAGNDLASRHPVHHVRS